MESEILTWPFFFAFFGGVLLITAWFTIMFFVWLNWNQKAKEVRDASDK